MPENPVSNVPAEELKILMVSAEVAPFAKVGGLADVAGSLPKALAALGHDVRVVMPGYPMVVDNPRFSPYELIPSVTLPAIPVAGDYERERFSVLATNISDAVPLYMVRHPRFFASAVSSATVYSQSVEAYLFFSRAIFAMLEELAPHWEPDVIHCNDWHMGLIPAMLNTVYRQAGKFRHTGSLFTIHNLAYQGLFGREVLNKVGLPQWTFTAEGMEFYGEVNFLKAGMVYADVANTVSPTYAREIQTEEYGCGLDGVTSILAGQGRLRGILNGIDTEVYDPSTDPHIASAFSAAEPDGKAKDRLALQREFGLDETEEIPLVGMVTRLASQKGLDILAPIAERLVEMGFQLIVLGQGQREYEDLFRTLAGRYPNRVGTHIGFDEAMGSRIYAGCDAFLMPSRFEPCGLGQMMSLRYGTIPIVRKTGGLADSVIDEDGTRADANGFVFEGYTSEVLLECMKRMKAVFANKPRWKNLVSVALAADFSWTNSARQYVTAYQDAKRGTKAEGV